MSTNGLHALVCCGLYPPQTLDWINYLLFVMVMWIQLMANGKVPTQHSHTAALQRPFNTDNRG